MQMSFDFSPRPDAIVPACVTKSKQGATAYAAGLLAEEACEQELVHQGQKILARRARMPSGELDLVTQDGDTVVFVEIKKRRSLEEAAYAISPRQVARIGDAALEWLQANALSHSDIRFDAALMDRYGNSKILKNALDFSVH